MMILSDAQQRFFRELRIRGYSERTLSAYAFDIKKFNVYLKNDMGLDPESIEVDEVDTEMIRRFIDQRIVGGNSVRTISRKLASLKSMFRFLHNERLIQENPTERLKLPRIRKKPPAALSQDEVRQLVGAPDPEEQNFHLDRALLIVLYSCGLRVSEASKLKILHLNLERHHIRVPGKGSKERIIPIQDSVRNALLEYLLHREQAMPDTMGPDEPLFLKQTKSGPRAMNVRRIQYLVEKCGRQAGLMTHAYPHLLRHSIATHMIEQGANVEAVRQTLGHEDLATTSIYIKASSKFLMDEHKKFNPTDNLIK